MSRIASVKETGEELSQADWQRFEDAVRNEVGQRPRAEPYQRATLVAQPPRSAQPSESDRKA